MAGDNWFSELDTAVWSARNAAAITPHDVNELLNWSRFIWVGGAGAIAVTMAEGQEVILSAVPVGILLPIQAKRIKATGTTATLLIALW